MLFHNASFAKSAKKGINVRFRFKGVKLILRILRKSQALMKEQTKILVK